MILVFTIREFRRNIGIRTGTGLPIIASSEGDGDGETEGDLEGDGLTLADATADDGDADPEGLRLAEGDADADGLIIPDDGDALDEIEVGLFGGAEDHHFSPLGIILKEVVAYHFGQQVLAVMKIGEHGIASDLVRPD